jgi:trk system potassium uptake protein TrkH
MHLFIIQRILGMMLMPFSLTTLPPMLISLWDGDGTLVPFLLAFLLIFLSGLLLWWPVRKLRQELRLRDGFLVVALYWIVLSLAGALPLMLSEEPHLRLTDAVFESVSGFTTTGATVLVGLDALPRSINYYRLQLQWLGGMGIVVLALAVLPMLGIGGLQLYRAEVPGPTKDKFTPRIAETAKILWYLYLALTVLCAVAYWLAGMSAFDAIAHSFATLSTGGFSTHDASFGYFNSPLISTIAALFMVLAGTNFALHFAAWQSFSLRPYRQDPELRAYLLYLLVATLITIGFLYIMHPFQGVGGNLHHGLFQVISAATSTGFTTVDFSKWPSLLPLLLLFIAFIGGCAGSTSGGIKVVRCLLLLKQGMREVLRLIHPKAQIPVKLGAAGVPDRIVDAVWGFFAAYVAAFAAMLLLLVASGLDQITAFSALTACMNNMGPGLGAVSANYASINDMAKWVLCLAMLLGRLEIFTLIVLFTPAFWRN